MIERGRGEKRAEDRVNETKSKMRERERRRLSRKRYSIVCDTMSFTDLDSFQRADYSKLFLTTLEASFIF